MNNDLITEKWFYINAKNQILGRVISQITQLIQGKNNSYYTPYLKQNNKIVVINITAIKEDKKKTEKKITYKHSEFPGGLKVRRGAELFSEKNIITTVKKVIKNMLPKKNKIVKEQLKNIYLYLNSEHPHKFNNVGIIKIIK